MVGGRGPGRQRSAALRDELHDVSDVAARGERAGDFTATATGGTGPYAYQLWVYDGVSWSLGRDWDAASSFTWVPPAAGTYTFQVWVRNAGSMTAYDAWAPLGPVTVIPRAPRGAEFRLVSPFECNF